MASGGGGAVLADREMCMSDIYTHTGLFMKIDRVDKGIQ
jgi:hypothetical protein